MGKWRKIMEKNEKVEEKVEKWRKSVKTGNFRVEKKSGENFMYDIKSKENSKVTNRLIRNEDMTKQEALKAKKKSKNYSLPPALSTRSHDSVLRK